MTKLTLDALIKSVASEFDGLTTLRQAPTSLEIGGYPHYENVLSNYLDFFLRNDDVHGLGPLVAHALFAAAHRLAPGLGFNTLLDGDAVSSQREWGIDQGTRSPLRIDLLLETATRRIAVEHKIYAPLYNNLSAYLTGIASADIESPLGIVLAPQRMALTEERYVAVGYADFIAELRTRLGDALLSATTSSRYLNILLEVIRTMESFTGLSADNEARRQAFAANQDAVDHLFGQFRDMQNQVRRRARSIANAFETNHPTLAASAVRVFQYQPSTEVRAAANVDFDLNGWRLAIDATCTAADTRITAFERTTVGAATLSTNLTSALERAGIEFHVVDNEASRVEIADSVAPWQNTDVDAIAAQVARVAEDVIQADVAQG